MIELLWSKTLSAPSFGRYWKQLIESPYHHKSAIFYTISDWFLSNNLYFHALMIFDPREIGKWGGCFAHDWRETTAISLHSGQSTDHFALHHLNTYSISFLILEKTENEDVLRMNDMKFSGILKKLLKITLLQHYEVPYCLG